VAHRGSQTATTVPRTVGLRATPDRITRRRWQIALAAAFEAEMSRIARSTYKTYYESQKLFDAHSRLTERRLDTILAAASPDKELQRQIGDLTANAVAAAALFRILAGHPTDANRPVAYVFSTMANRAHPLARAAMAFLRFEHLGGTLTADQEAIITLCKQDALLKRAVDAYIAARTPATF
jgi:hypothetical protein